MKAAAIKIIFLVNHIAMLLYMCLLIKTRAGLDTQRPVPFIVASFMLFDIVYICSSHIRENKILFLFCVLLGFDGWYVLLSFETSWTAELAFYIVSPVIWYMCIRFIFMFLFQDSGYKFRKPVNYILLAACIGPLLGAFGPEKIYAGLYGIQFLVNMLIFVFIIAYHRKRVVYVIKSQKKYIILSLAITFAGFFSYYFLTLKIPNHIANFGVYLPILIFFFSVHGILCKEHHGVPLTVILDKKQLSSIFLCSVSIGTLIIACLEQTFIMLLIVIHALAILFFICNLFMEWNLKRGKSQLARENKYQSALSQLRQEENMKAEFANFLHDEVLQDLLSIKNLVKKADRQDVQEIMEDTLNTLNIRIREQMQEYHPVILKKLTAKENYQNLIEAVARVFPNKKISVSFECLDMLFLVEPYILLIYRMMKELLTNVYKYSDGNKARITLTQENGIIELTVRDNGTGDRKKILSADRKEHKGILSIKEQTQTMDGELRIFNTIPQGITVQIVIPMKGDDSYKYFIS